MNDTTTTTALPRITVTHTMRRCFATTEDGRYSATDDGKRIIVRDRWCRVTMHREDYIGAALYDALVHAVKTAL